MEIWKKHPRYEIEVSSHGRVKTLTRVHTTSNGNRTYKGKLVKLTDQYTGKGKSMYQKCHLYVPSAKSKNHWVHRLVAETFVDNPNEYKYVDHVDSNGLNNRSDNLEWVTNSVNVRRAIAKGNFKNVRYHEGKSYSDVARTLGAKPQLIQARLRRKWCISCATSIPSTGIGGDRSIVYCKHNTDIRAA